MAKKEPFDRFSDACDEWFSRNSVFYSAELQAIMPNKLTGRIEQWFVKGLFVVIKAMKNTVRAETK